MCRPASFVLTRDRVFWSRESDSHEAIIQKFGLHADGVRGPNIVRVEVTADDMRDPLPQWQFRVDQDLLPEWYVPSEVEQRARVALVEWAEAKLFVDRHGSVWDEECYACGSSHVVAYGSSHVKACGSSHVVAYDSSHVEAYGSSHVVAYDSSHVEAYGSSHVKAYDSSHVKAYDSSHVKAYDSSHVKAYVSSHVKAYDSSHVKAYDDSHVKTCGSSHVEAYGSSHVVACGSSHVVACDDYSTVRHFSSSIPIRPSGPHAVVIDSRGSRSVVITAAAGGQS